MFARSSRQVAIDRSPRIEADQLSVAYPLGLRAPSARARRGQHRALNGVSFTLQPGQRLGLLGRNGSGKSTLLKTLAGVYPPLGGDLRVTGSIAAIFNAALGFIKEATGRENIYLRGAMLGMKFDDIRALEPDIETFSELGEWIDQPIHRYSSGMQLRLAFAITTAVRSDIMLFDEWIGAGDAAFLKKARERLADMVESASILVLASHNMKLLKSQCNEAMVLENGQVSFHGDVDEAIERYENLKTTDPSGQRLEGKARPALSTDS